MKKILLTTTLLVATAGVAAADVTLSGSGRFGLTYFGGAADGTKETQLSYRMRVNIDASKETDSGVTFGGRIRLQYDNGDSASFTSTNAGPDGIPGNADDIVVSGSTGAGAELSAAYLYAESGGFRMEVGNANGAFDSLATLYNSELGFIGTTQGSYGIAGDYASFSSGPFSGSQADRVGLFVSYDIENLSAKLSYHTPDQTVEDLPAGDSEEYSVAVDYTAGQFKVGAGYVANGGFVDDSDAYALTAEYALNDNTNVGAQYIALDTPGLDQSGFTLYGNTKLASGLGLGAFLSTYDSDDFEPENDLAFGIGASYDIGGATVAGTIQQTFNDDTYADLGVSFSF